MNRRCSGGHAAPAQHRRAALTAAAIGLAAATTAAGCGAARVHDPAAQPPPARRANVVVLITDDQSLGSVNAQVTPNIYRWFVRHGRSYPSFFAADPLCAPSRAAILTGRFNHRNGVRDNGTGAASLSLDMRSEVQCTLQQHGYVTAIYGKFLNGYDYRTPPPCLSHYAVTPGDQHSGLPFLVDGRTLTPPGWQDEYIDRMSTGFLAARALEPTRPFFLVESFLEPHSPYHGLPPSVATRPVPAPFVSPSVTQPASQMARMTPLIRAHATAEGYAFATWNAEERMMMNVDRYVGNVFSALRRNGRLGDTLVVLVSDNGILLGEHHLIQKRLPYTESFGVPAYVYGPRWVGRGPSTDRRLAENVDITPTILQAAGIRPPPGDPLDGRSLLRPGWRRPYVLGESWRLKQTAWQPPWRSIRSQTFQYIEYLSDGSHPAIIGREYYDLVADPYEMNNLLADADPNDNPDIALLHAETVAAAGCRGTSGERACP